MQTKSSNTAIRGTTLFRQLILPSIIAVLLAGAAIPASADFASDTTPVDMRNYYPNANWNSPAFPDTLRRCQYVTGGGRWHGVRTRQNSSGRRYV